MTRDYSTALEQLERFKREAADLAFRLDRFQDDSGLPVDVEFTEFAMIDEAADACRHAGESLAALINEIKEFKECEDGDE